MKSIRVHAFGEPDVLKLEDLPEPTPAAGQILVRIAAIGVNPVETYIRKGMNPIPLPYTPGTDAAGVVEAVSPEISAFKPGDRVYLINSLTGTYAQKALCLPKHLIPLPTKLTFAQGAAVGIPYATAYRALVVRGAATPGQSLLVHGASGSVGLAAIQIARALGLTIFATASTPKGQQLAAENGAHHVLDHSKPDYLDQLMSLTGKQGVNLVLEMLANVNLGKDLTILAPKGIVVVIGSRGPVEINPRDAMNRDADIRPMKIANASDAELASHHAALVAGFENGSLRPIIRCEMPLAQAPKAHELVMSPGAHGKIILTP
jgi:NADPH2:quinone reductase